MFTRLLRTLLMKPLDAMSARYDYDITYLRHIGTVDSPALLRFGLFSTMSGWRRDLPVEPWLAAKLVATLHDDCGPCTQLVVNMAREARVPDATLRALLRHDLAALPADTALVAEFARLSLAHDPEADPLREQIRARWGERALVTVAYAIATSRVFPALKYALGHGQACSRIQLGNEQLAPQRAAMTGAPA